MKTKIAMELNAIKEQRPRIIPHNGIMLRLSFCDFSFYSSFIYSSLSKLAAEREAKEFIDKEKKGTPSRAVQYHGSSQSNKWLYVFS